MPVYSTPSLRSADLPSSKPVQVIYVNDSLRALSPNWTPTTLLDANALGYEN